VGGPGQVLFLPHKDTRPVKEFLQDRNP